MREGWAHHHKVYGTKGLLRVSHHPGAGAAHDQVDLVLGMVVHRVVELGVGVVEDDEKVLLMDGYNLLLHGANMHKLF